MTVIRRRATSRHAEGGEHKYRHPYLKFGTTRLFIYRYVLENPGVTFKQIKTLTSSGQPVTDLVNAGLLRTEGESKQSFRYYAVPENETGPGRDEVVVETTLYINEFGEYSAVSKVVGQQLLATTGELTEVITKTVKISVPSPREKAGTVNTKDEISAKRFVKDAQTAVSGLIIEGDYTIIPK